MKKTIVTVVIELQDTEHEQVKHVIDYMINNCLYNFETYNIVDIEDIEE